MRPWNSCLELMETSLRILLLTLRSAGPRCSLRLHRSGAAGSETGRGPAPVRATPSPPPPPEEGFRLRLVASCLWGKQEVAARENQIWDQQREGWLPAETRALENAPALLVNVFKGAIAALQRVC